MENITINTIQNKKSRALGYRSLCGNHKVVVYSFRKDNKLNERNAYNTVCY